MNNHTLKFVVKQQKPHSLQSYLKEIIGIPKGLLHDLRMSKQVLVNGDTPNWTTQLQDGAVLSLPILAEELSLPAMDLEIEVVYENEHFMIVNKEAGIETHPSSENVSNSLANGVAHYFHVNGIHSKVRHIHRLDKDTSGAILFAKHAISGAILDRLLEERKVKRTYLALVEGDMQTKSGIVDKAIGKDRHHSSRRRISPNGQKAVTHYKVIKKFPNEGLTLVELTLDTGRTHQIRVHMSSLGHPLYGDKLYGAKKRHIRHSLHAWKLVVPHPFTDETIKVYAPIPNGFGPTNLNFEEL